MRRSEHLIAAADAEHVAAAPAMSFDVDVPAGLAQRGEVGDGRLGAGQDDEVGVVPGSGSPGRRKIEFHAGLERERVEVVEVGDARIGEHGDERLAAGRRLSSATVEGERVLGGQAAGVLEERHEAEAGPAGGLLDGAHAVVEQRGIAAELVDDEARDHGPRPRVRCTALVPTRLAMTPPRSMSPMRTTGTFGGAGEAHVGDVAGAQVDLGRGARAFDEHEIGIRRRACRSCRAHAP